MIFPFILLLCFLRISIAHMDSSRVVDLGLDQMLSSLVYDEEDAFDVCLSSSCLACIIYVKTLKRILMIFFLYDFTGSSYRRF